MKLVRIVCRLCLAVWATSPWAQAQAQAQAELGVQTFAGLTLTGEIGTVYSVEYLTDLARTNDSSAWNCLEFLQLPASPHFVLLAPSQSFVVQ
jgi:hypothetical protein